MRRLEALILALVLVPTAGPAAAQLPSAQLPPAQFLPVVTLDELLRMVERNPRIVASRYDADAARAERVTAGALPNPSLSVGSSRPSGGDRTIFNGSSQQQVNIDLPIPIFGQRAARERAAERQVDRAESQIRLTESETRRQSALEFVRLLTAQEQLAARRSALTEVDRIRSLVAGRLESGMASRYDLARADAELALAAIGVQRAEAEQADHAAALAGLADAPGWRPRAAGSLAALQAGLKEPDAELALARSPAARVAREETSAAEARIEVAQRERLPVPSLAVGRTWTSGPFGAANFIGLSSEIPLLDDKRGLADKARADAAAARERERAANAAVFAEYQRQRDTLQVRRSALDRFRSGASERQDDFLEMAETAYRLGRGTLFELLDARRTRLEAAAAQIELIGAVIEAQVELRALAGEL